LLTDSLFTSKSFFPHVKLCIANTKAGFPNHYLLYFFLFVYRSQQQEILHLTVLLHSGPRKPDASYWSPCILGP